MNISWRKDEPILWNGISYSSGGFTSSGSFAYQDLVGKDATIMQNEYLFTQGFENNGILLANLLNLEFLFDDDNAPDYSINRYFGMYVNEIEEGQFDISGEGFYKNTEKTQLPKIKTITEVSQELNTPFEITNDEGILIFLDPTKTTTITGVPTPERVDEVESIFYVKDKDDNFHTIKKGSKWGPNQIRLFDKKMDVSVLAGFDDPDTFANASILNREGFAQMYITVKDTIYNNSKISFYDGSTLTGEIFADETLAPSPGRATQRFFCPNGTPQEIAQSITAAINNGINENDRFFTATYNDDTVYIISRFSGSRFNQLNFKVGTDYPELFEDISTYPVTTLSDPNKNFVGGNNVSNALLKVTKGDQDRFVKGDFVQTKDGYAVIGDWVPYTDEKIEDPNGNCIGYTDIDKYVIITCDDNQIMVTRSNQVALYSDYRPSFGRFSFFGVRDFDVDFYSTLYSEEGELVFEDQYYNQSVPGSVNPIIYEGASTNPEIREFYDNGGFFNLIGLLKDSDPEKEGQGYITSPYIRLEENFLTSQSAISRIVPYINKWGWINDGKDVRNHPYRLDLSESFGLNNFAPSKYDRGREASGYTHEWYYLSEFPKYFNKPAIESSWSYIDKAPTDTTTSTDPLTGQTTTSVGTFQKIDKDYFEDYFIVDRFTTGGITLIDRQLRYGRFEGGNANNFAETFLRGVRIIAKPKAIGSQKPDFDARALSYVYNEEFNDYRFSAILVPNLPDKPESQVKFIKNEKWKTVVMLISVNLVDSCINNGASIIDRTTLYSYENQYVTDATCAPEIDTAGEYVFTDGTLQGAINFASSSFDGSIQQYEIVGMPDANGIPTSFLSDIKIGLDGGFNDVKIRVSLGPNPPFFDNYVIGGITEVVSDTLIRATFITKNGAPFVLPTTNPSVSTLQNAEYSTDGGGFGEFNSRLNNIAFADIFENVNRGNPNVVYETVDKDGNTILNSDGSLAQTFSIELRAQSDILKATYIGVLPDPNKPTAFNLTDIIGYDLSLQTKPRLTPIARHAGYYAPIAQPIIFFRDPYANIDFGASVTGGVTGSGNIPDEAYKLKVLELCKWCNTQFHSSNLEFGQLKNFFYHKVNEQDPSTVLELSEDSAFPSLYPLINEIGIDYKDFYVFSSNWEPSYFIKSIDKTQIEEVIGTRSMKERKSFFGSKYLKVPEKIVLETFTPSTFVKSAIKQPDLIDGTFMFQDTASVRVRKKKINLVGTREVRSISKKGTQPFVTFYLFNEKRLKEFLFTPIKEQFIKYINPLYGFGDLETLDDDVNRYIEENILRLYKIEKVEFYTLASREKGSNTYTTAELTDAEKISAGLTINESVSSKTLNTNPFDLRLIYNKRTGFTESFGFSVTIVKK